MSGSKRLIYSGDEALLLIDKPWQEVPGSVIPDTLYNNNKSTTCQAV